MIRTKLEAVCWIVIAVENYYNGLPLLGLAILLWLYYDMQEGAY